jgi:TPR repeat protein
VEVACSDPGPHEPVVDGTIASCNEGKTRACTALGILYQNGEHGLTADAKCARRAYQHGCDLRDVQACNNLAVMLEGGQGGPQELQRAFTLYKEGCEADHALACRNVGRFFRDGLAVQRDDAKAAAAFARAASNSTALCTRAVAEGCSNLGFMYRSGKEGLPMDEARAQEFFQKACDIGYNDICKLVRSQ